MKTLKLSTVATFLCLFCMGMGFPNLEEEGREKDQCSKKKSEGTYMRTAAMGCSRGIQLSTPKLTRADDAKKTEKPVEKAENPVCSAKSLFDCLRKNV